MAPLLALALAAVALAVAAPASAQPEPSFRVSCGEVRRAIAALPPGDALVTIQVEGRLTHVQSDAAVTYMLMCAPPDPLVLCVTYASNGRQPGETVLFSGSYVNRGPDHVQLDPCLHSAAD